MRRTNVTASRSVIVDLPVEKFDLADWIIHFSNEDYIACTPASKAHQIMYVHRDGDGEYVLRNDEYVGGFQMTQLYRPQIMEKDHVFLVSPATRGRFLSVMPMKFQTSWDMKVEPYQGNRSLFTCTIGGGLSWWQLLASKFTCLNYWSEAHCEEEGPHFADSAALWATRNDANQRASYVNPDGQYEPLHGDGQAGMPIADLPASSGSATELGV